MIVTKCFDCGAEFVFPAAGMDKETGDGKARIHSTLSRVGSPPLVVMESDEYK